MSETQTVEIIWHKFPECEDKLIDGRKYLISVRAEDSIVLSSYDVFEATYNLNLKCFSSYQCKFRDTVLAVTELPKGWSNEN